LEEIDITSSKQTISSLHLKESDLIKQTNSSSCLKECDFNVGKINPNVFPEETILKDQGELIIRKNVGFINENENDCFNQFYSSYQKIDKDIQW